MNEVKPIYYFVSKENDKPQDFTCFQLQSDHNLNCEVHVLASKAENTRAESWREKDRDEQKGFRQSVTAIPSYSLLTGTVQIADLQPCNK